jgi:hypothetical protein
MHITIAVPADMPVVDLARALATIGLHAVHGYHRTLTFDRGPGALPPTCCTEAGCDHVATTRDRGEPLCARHWIAAREV